MKIKYYAIYGVNGLGIYTDYDKVLEAKKFISKGYKVKAYATWEEVNTACILGYNDLQENWADCYREEEIKRDNFTLYRKQIRTLNSKKEAVCYA